MNTQREPDSERNRAAGDSFTHTPLDQSRRFAPPPTRRDFLGLAAFWSSVAAFFAATIGALRLPMPAVFPESNSQVKIGPPDSFPIGTASHLADLRVWVFRDVEGIYAISSICTHLGCIAGRGEDREFTCPCHGSRFAADGRVKAGPAPKSLNWLAMSQSPDGQLVVDKIRTVKPGTRIPV